ncbi:methyltransferase [Gayadomonas joobiniege]|uniref:methyltransferase n=1 Tax=Gayadomonas joobiniege TaxID=1234606 RepID=UPI000370D5CC|nr:methyltransferase [Gayadomonas joobiniege]
MNSQNIQPAVRSLSEILKRHQSCWNFVPFAQRQIPWGNKKIDEIVAQFSTEADSIVQQGLLNAVFTDLKSWLDAYQASLESVLHSPSNILPEIPFWLKNGIHGRKIEQIKALSSQLQGSDKIIEWCSGKGHLGRILAYQHNISVTSLEWQAHLCQQGEALAQKYQLAQKFYHTDVLQDDLSFLNSKYPLVALHACGDLHLKLLRQVQLLKSPQVYLAPCCYHLINDELYTGVSEFVKSKGLAVTKAKLKLAVQAQVTSGERIKRLRKTEVVWRLAYQALREAITGDDSYKSLPSVQKSYFSGAFKDFALWGLAHQGLSYDRPIQESLWLQKGLERHKFIQMLERVRHVFQRPLEYWLVLDRALFLVEQGYQVQVNAFCDYAITPRNLFIRASL